MRVIVFYAAAIRTLATCLATETDRVMIQNQSIPDQILYIARRMFRATAD